MKEEWEEEFRIPTIEYQQELDAHVDVRGMVEDAFQRNGEPPTLEEKVVGIVGEADHVEEEPKGAMIMLLIFVNI